MAAGKYGFPKSLRIHLERDFQRVKSEGKPARMRFFNARYVHTGEDRRARFAIRTSRQVGNAVTRNHLRRIYRELIRHSRDRFPPGDMVVLNVKPSAASAARPDLERDFARLLDRVSRCARN